MKVYFDTNLLVADAVSEHPYHAYARRLFDQVEDSSWKPVILCHGVSEFYAVLTRTPWRQRISADTAWQLIDANVIERFELITLSAAEHLDTVRSCAQQGLAGAVVYDALHMTAARKAGCERIYTYNVKHFRQVAPDLHDRILLP